MQRTPETVILERQDDLQPALGAYIKGARDKAGMTLADVSEATGLNIGYLSLIENGKRKPKWTTFERIVKAISDVLERRGAA